MRRSARGFTFVEILVALAVFSALTALAVPRYRGYKERAYIANLKTELGSLRIAQEAYWSEHLTYAADTAYLDWNGSSQVHLEITSGDFASGFTAVATHHLLQDTECTTRVGREVSGAPAGDIVCGAKPNIGTGVTN
jgi:type IV pilus assembly protein PilA